MLLSDQVSGNSFMVIVVCAKCDKSQRLELWENTHSIANDLNIPWIIGGDINVVLNGAEKIWGLPMVLEDVEDFHHCVGSCDLT